MPIQYELRRIVEHRETLSQDESACLMQKLLASEASDVEIAGLLGALAGRGETAAELAGFAAALRSAANSFPITERERKDLTDSCGTGGDASGSFNISTAAALVAAAAGAKVAKHGNRAITSRCGSADVLEVLGVPVDLSASDAAESLRRHNFCFLLAPAHHPQLRAVMPVRRALGVRTILHVLGPLLNPAGARRQVMGVYQSRLVPLAAQALALLGAQHAMVVHGDGNLDEIALSGPTEIAEVRDGRIAQFTVTPEEFNLERAPLSALAGGDASTNARMISAIFEGQTGPTRDIVLLNAAAVLVTSGVAAGIGEGIALAAQTIDSGAAQRLVAALSAP